MEKVFIIAVQKIKIKNNKLPFFLVWTTLRIIKKDEALNKIQL